MGCVYSKPERRVRDDEVARERRALSCCFKGNGARGYEPLTETLDFEDPEHEEQRSPDNSHGENLQQKLAETEAEVQHLQQSLEQQETELQIKITDLESQIALLQGHITDLEDGKNKLIAAKEQELQNERAQLLKCIITQQEEHEKKITDEEAEVRQSLEQHETERNELQVKIADLESQIALLQGQITDLEDGKNKLIAAKEQELQNERAQLLKRITTQKQNLSTQQEEHNKMIAEKEAEVQSLQQSLEQHKEQLQKVQAALPPSQQDQVYAEAHLKDLVKNLEEVDEWFRFGINLDVAEKTLLEIRVNERGVVDQCRLQVLVEWGKKERRTWREVVRALLAVGRKRLAQELAEKYGVPLPQNVDDITQQHVTSTEERQLKVQEMENEVADKEVNLRQVQISEASLEKEVKENIGILPQLQSQLKMAVYEKSSLEEELEATRRKCHHLQELYVLADGQQEKSREHKEELKELCAGLIKEKEHQISTLKKELEAKDNEITHLWQELGERKAELSQKTKELEEVTKRVQMLEREKEQLRSQWEAESRTVDRKLQEQVAKATSQTAYLHQVRIQLSIAKEMVEVKDKEAADYKQQISQKEKEIAILSERLQHHEAEMINMDPHGTTVDYAGSRETLEAFHKEISQIAETSELKMRLLRAENEKQQLEVKEKPTLQEVVCHREEISQLSLDPMKCRAVGPGVESAKKHQLAQFEVHLVDAAGDTYKYTTDPEIGVWLKCLSDDSVSKANTTKKDQATYTVSYKPTKPGKHEIAVTVNGTPIQDSPFQVLVHNTAHPGNSTAVGSGLELTETQQLTTFELHLADIDGDPCVVNQDVTAELKSIVNGSQVKAKVVSKSPAIYEVSYKPIIRGRHDLSVRVNGLPIQGSPFRVYVRQPPHLMHTLVREIGTDQAIDDITITRNGDLVVFGDNKLLFYTRHGQIIKTVELDFRSHGRIAIDSSDNVYIVSGDQLYKFNLSGKVVKSVMIKEEQRHFAAPSGIALYKDKLFICHKGNCRIHIFDTGLNFIETHGDGEIKDPRGLAIDSDGNLYVGDGDGSIHVLSQSGTYLRKIETPRSHNEDPDRCQNRWIDIHVDRDWVYYGMNEEGNVSVFTMAGKFIGSVRPGLKPRLWSSFINQIVCITMDEDGFVYIVIGLVIFSNKTCITVY